jgi:hypothetical protein
VVYKKFVSREDCLAEYEKWRTGLNAAKPKAKDAAGPR